MRPSLSLRTLSLHSYTTAPPTPAQLDFASRIFNTREPKHLLSLSSLRDFPTSSLVPEVLFLGRSNAGKSSLLNALLGQPRQADKLARVSRRPGKTRCLNIFGVGGARGGSRWVVQPGLSKELLEKTKAERKKARAEAERKRERGGGGGGGDGSRAAKRAYLHDRPRRDTARDGEVLMNWLSRGPARTGVLLIDCPGYGYGSRDAWGESVVRYLRGRTTLRRAFVLVCASHGLKRSDMDALDLLHKLGTPHQIVLSKVDRVLFPSGRGQDGGLPAAEHVAQLMDICKDIRDKVAGNRTGATVMPDILCTSAQLRGSHGEIRLGINDLRWEVCRAAGFDEKVVDKKELKEWRDQLTVTEESNGIDALEAAMAGG